MHSLMHMIFNASESSILLEGDIDLPEISATELQHVSLGSSTIQGGQADKLEFQSSLPETEHGLNCPSELLFSPKLSEADDELPPPISNFPADLISLTTVNKSAEKSRRFPVPLSDSEATIVVKGPLLSGVDNTCKEDKSNGEGIERDEGCDTESDVDDSGRPSSSQGSHLLAATLRSELSTNDGPLQDILESKIAHLEVTNAGISKCDDEELKRARARKKQVKEVRALLDGTDKTLDEKLWLLNAKYLQQVSETKLLEKDVLSLRRKYEQINKEKDTIYGEYTKVSMLRQKLESLCRELQRQNKMLLDDSKRTSMDEQMKRQELSTKFHNTIKDITNKLEEQGDERLQQIKENELLRDKLKVLTQQYEIRDQQFSHQLRTKVLEQQLAEVKLKQQEELFAQEEAKTRLYNNQITHQLQIEQDLRAQLALYGDKFEQFQETLTKSNEMFATFKNEMEKMSKSIKKLEKENLTLKKKTEKSDASISELLEERTSLKKQLYTSTNQKEKLESLCRSLQAERKSSLSGTLPSQASLQAAMSAVEPEAS